MKLPSLLLCLIALSANAAPPITPVFTLVDSNGTIIGQVAGTDIPTGVPPPSPFVTGVVAFREVNGELAAIKLIVNSATGHQVLTGFRNLVIDSSRPR